MFFFRIGSWIRSKDSNELGAAIHTFILWPLGFQRLNDRLLRDLRVYHRGSSGAVGIGATFLQGIHIDGEFDRIRRSFGAQVIETRLAPIRGSAWMKAWQC